MLSITLDDANADNTCCTLQLVQGWASYCTSDASGRPTYILSGPQ